MKQGNFQTTLLLIAGFVSFSGGADGVLAAEPKTATSKSEGRDKFEIQIEKLLDKSRTAAVREKLNHLPTDASSARQRKIWLACCDEVDRRYEEALDGFKQSGDLSRQPAFVLRSAANTNARMQEYKEAIRLFELIKAGERTFADYDMWGDCDGALGKIEQATENYQCAAKLLPARSGGVLTKAASFYLKDGKPQVALKLVEEALARGGADYVPALMGKTMCLERLGRWSEAAQSATRVIELTKPGAAREEGKAQLTLSAGIAERIKCYDKLGKKDLAAADRKWQEELAKKVSKDIGI